MSAGAVASAGTWCFDLIAKSRAGVPVAAITDMVDVRGAVLSAVLPWVPSMLLAGCVLGCLMLFAERDLVRGDMEAAARDQRAYWLPSSTGGRVKERARTPRSRGWDAHRTAGPGRWAIALLVSIAVIGAVNRLVTAVPDLAVLVGLVAFTWSGAWFLSWLERRDPMCAVNIRLVILFCIVGAVLVLVPATDAVAFAAFSAVLMIAASPTFVGRVTKSLMGGRTAKARGSWVIAVSSVVVFQFAFLVQLDPRMHQVHVNSGVGSAALEGFLVYHRSGEFAVLRKSNRRMVVFSTARTSGVEIGPKVRVPVSRPRTVLQLVVEAAR